MDTNNYVRIDHDTILPFDDKDKADVERIKGEVAKALETRPKVRVALWKACRHLEYPTIGQPMAWVYREDPSKASRFSQTSL